MLILTLAMLLSACTDTSSDTKADDTQTESDTDTDADSDTDTDTDTDADTDTDTDADADADADTDSDTDTDTGTALELSVIGPDAECGGGDPEALKLTSNTASVIDVKHVSFQDGCCPEYLRVELTGDAETSTIRAVYEVGPDPCECICKLDASYRIEGVPSGTWTVGAGAVTGTVEVP